MSEDGITFRPKIAGGNATRDQGMGVGTGGGSSREDRLERTGYWILVLSLLFLVTGVYAIGFGHMVPRTGITVIDFVRDDTHYKYLVPLLIPVTFYAIIVNWMGLKYFRHA